MDSRLRAVAYVLARMPATFAAARAALAELAMAVPSLEPSRVLDLGAGTGAMTWAAIDTFDSLSAVTLADYATDALDLAVRMLAEAPVEVDRQDLRLDRTGSHADGPGAADPVAARPGEVGSGAEEAARKADGTAGLALAGYVLGELDAQGRDAVVDRLARSAGTVLVVEPGTPAGYARVLRARERLLEAGMRIAAPCPHELACPLGPGDWCHAAARLERTAAHRQAKGGSRGFEDEKFAYVAATRLPVQPAAARVLRHPQVRPGHVRLQLCESDGRAREVTVSKRDKAAFRAARKVAWGQGWDPAGEDA
ncbi:rRNA methyltransferase [Ruania alkalisoli]|uniref:rRNA methyltransferase n=2 Tax=Ruania alkalisoli TaxID=2779775 RepID=A0A7M1SZB4_9MICO|nr:rRNA methyltransferase [Ruania alkalisoli]